jgi:uncharacterized membrane protein YidH (DUF202 family)
MSHPINELAMMRWLKIDCPLPKEDEMNIPIWIWVLVGIILVVVIVRMV